MKDIEYAGFWIRTAATLIDTVLLMIITLPILSVIYGGGYFMSEAFISGFWDVVLSYIFPAIATILFWIYRGATPGKMAFKISIVDARNGGKPSTGQLIGRYFGYYVSILTLMIGYIWVGIDKKKQGFHDKLSKTVVVRNLAKAEVKFDG